MKIFYLVTGVNNSLGPLKIRRELSVAQPCVARFRWNLAWYVSAWLASWFVIKAEKDYLLTGGNNCFIEAPDNKARKFIELSVAQPRVGPISLKFGLIRECMTGLVVRY